MKAGWSLVQLGELTEPTSPITYGVIKPGEEGDVLFVRGGDISDGNIRINQLRTITKEISEQYSRTLLKGGELLMCLVGQPGQVAIAPHNLAGANIARQVGLIRLRSNFNAEFIKYFLQSPDGQKRLGAQTGGSVQQVINLSDLRTIEIPLPSAAEQQRIVAILDEAFEAIAAARANAEQNRQNARALFESYLQSVFSLRGEGWIDSRLGEIAEVQSGGTPTVSQKDFWGGDIPWYSSGELNHTFTSVPERHITADGLEHSNAKLFPKGSLLVGMYDTAALKMSILDRDGAFNQAIAGIKPNHRIDVEFILHAINAAKPKLLLERRGVRQKNLSLGKIKDISIPLPTLEIQRSILVRIRKLAYETQRLQYLYQRKIAALDELKQSLLQQAFSGQL